MATNQNIKDTTTFLARADNLFYADGKVVGNSAMVRFRDALKASYSYPGGGAWPFGRPDANDAAAWFYKQAEALVKSTERMTAEAAVVAPADFQN